jgi:hypothetical protein
LAELENDGKLLKCCDAKLMDNSMKGLGFFLSVMLLVTIAFAIAGTTQSIRFNDKCHAAGGWVKGVRGGEFCFRNGLLIDAS